MCNVNDGRIIITDDDFNDENLQLGALDASESATQDINSTKQKFSLFLSQLERNHSFMWCGECSDNKLILPLWTELRDHFIHFHTEGWEILEFESWIAPDFIHKVQAFILSFHTSNQPDRDPVALQEQFGEKRRVPDFRYWQSISHCPELPHVGNEPESDFLEGSEIMDHLIPPPVLISPLHTMGPSRGHKISCPTCTAAPGISGGFGESTHIKRFMCPRADKCGNHIFSQRKSRLDMLSKTSQWRMLKGLRRKFKSGQFHFRGQASNGSTALKEFATRCPRPDDLLDEGILTYRDILEGHPPTTLQGVFAFVSLSFAMNAAMEDQGRDIQFSPSKAEFGLWRNSIKSDEERRIFDEITHTLWLQGSIQTSWPDAEFHQWEDGQIGESMRLTVGSFLDEMNSYDDMDFTMFDPFSSFDPGWPYYPFDYTSNMPSNYDIPEECPSPTRHPPNEAPSSQQIEPGIPQSLSDTNIFCSVTRFVKGICSSCSFTILWTNRMIRSIYGGRAVPSKSLYQL